MLFCDQYINTVKRLWISRNADDLHTDDREFTELNFITMMQKNWNLKLNDVTGDTWTLSDFWDDGAGGGRVSVGLAVVMLVVDIVMYSIITWYIDSINPGPYGKRKPFTFIFKVISLPFNSSIKM